MGFLDDAASASIPQQQPQNLTSFGSAPLVQPPPVPRFQPPQTQIPKAGNEFNTSSGNKRATKQALFSNVASLIKSGTDYVTAKKTRALQMDIERLMEASEGRKEALAKLQQDPHDEEAAKAVQQNTQILNDIAKDPKKSKQLQKAFNIDLFGTGKNKQENQALIAAWGSFNKKQQAGDKSSLNPAAEKILGSQPVRQQISPEAMVQAQAIKAGLLPGANEVLKANTETMKALSTAKTAEERNATLEKAAKERADAIRYHADKVMDAVNARNASAKDIADINARARKYVADSTAREWDKRIEIMRGKEGTNPIFKSLSKDADTYNTELKNLITENTKTQTELDKMGSSIFGFKLKAASGPDAKMMQNKIQINNLRMDFLTHQLDEVRGKLKNLSTMGLINVDESNNTPNDASTPADGDGDITVTEKDMQDD